MGIEYSIVNHKNKTCFELGKGSWGNLVDYYNNSENTDLLYVDSIYNVIVSEIWSYYLETYLHNQDEEMIGWWKNYAQNVAKQIYNFVCEADPSEISIANDSDDSYQILRENGYRWVGSRYEQTDFNHLNRHLIK